MRFLENAKAWGQKAGQWLPRAGEWGRESPKLARGSIPGDGRLLNGTVVMNL